MKLVDTHCHIHEENYQLDQKEVIKTALEHNVDKLICVGTDEKTSQMAVDFVQDKDNCWATVGLHPHDAKLGELAFEEIKRLAKKPKVVGIGECGLDYFYNYSDKTDQIKAIEFQMQLALDHNLPMSFHVREAFDDFWPIFDNFRGLRGVVHSFTADKMVLDQLLKRDLFVGLNGIMTFTKDEAQLSAARAIPLEKLLLETDAPFLTPKPYRGKINEPKNILLIAEFLAKQRGESLAEVAQATSDNVTLLFGI